MNGRKNLPQINGVRLVVEERDLGSCTFMPISWIIEDWVVEGRGPEEYFIKCLCAYSFLWYHSHVFIPLSHPLHPGPSLCHISATFPSSILSVVCPFLGPPVSPSLSPSPYLPSFSHSLDDFKWPQGKLFGVQVEFRRRPSSPSTLPV